MISCILKIIINLRKILFNHKNLFLRAEHYLKHIYKFQGNENGKINNCFEKQILFINYLIERLECNLIFQQNKSNFGKSNYFLCKKNILKLIIFAKTCCFFKIKKYDQKYHKYLAIKKKKLRKIFRLETISSLTIFSRKNNNRK